MNGASLSKSGLSLRRWAAVGPSGLRSTTRLPSFSTNLIQCLGFVDWDCPLRYDRSVNSVEAPCAGNNLPLSLVIGPPESQKVAMASS